MSLDQLGIPDSFKTDTDRSCDILRSFGAREMYLFGSLSNRVLKRLWSLFNTTLICAIAQKTEGFLAIAKQDVEMPRVFRHPARGSWNDHSDLDLAVRGLQPTVYFKALGELLANSAHAVDLIDLEDGSPYSKRLIDKAELVKIA